MLTILYEDADILVVVKPAGMESQSTRRLEPDMVSEIKKYRSRVPAGGISTKTSTKASTGAVDNYVGVIHRLDKPVDGVMVYAKTKEAAAALSRQVQNGQMRKRYLAVICGKPHDNQRTYVDYLWKTGSAGGVRLVDKGAKEAKRSELSYRVRKTLPTDEKAMPMLSLVEIELLTGRYHQIRVQFAGRGMPLWGDARYNPLWGGTLPTEAGAAGMKAEKLKTPNQQGLALSAVCLSLVHPRTGKRIECSMQPQKPIFELFSAH